jgi:PncC family amidohydrolase
MALGARERFGADIAVAVTGIAGPSGGSTEKPVGLVWFATADSQGVQTQRALFPQSGRGAVRARSTATALDLLRLALLKE